MLELDPGDIIVSKDDQIYKVIVNPLRPQPFTDVSEVRYFYTKRILTHGGGTGSVVFLSEKAIKFVVRKSELE